MCEVCERLLGSCTRKKPLILLLIDETATTVLRTYGRKRKDLWVYTILREGKDVRLNQKTGQSINASPGSCVRCGASLFELTK